MAERFVCFRTPFFDDLDRQLPAERHVSGAPSAMDFLLYELPTIRDLLAADFEAITTAVGGRDPLRLYLGTGTLVRAVALYCVRAADDHIDVVGLELDLEWWDQSPDADDE